MRGEYPSKFFTPEITEELPPRARRIPPENRPHSRRGGTTSACAENTHNFFAPPNAFRNYLRVRGEYAIASANQSNDSELPPRARRIPPVVRSDSGGRGTTSACAENTTRHPNPCSIHRNYLRVRGEYSRSFHESSSNMELPPRARRIQNKGKATLRGFGTTSACAENTHISAV